MAAIGVKGLIENFSESDSPRPHRLILGRGRGAAAPPAPSPRPKLQPSIGAPALRTSWFPRLARYRSLLGTFGPPVVQERTSAGQNFFRPCQLVENFGPDLPEYCLKCTNCDRLILRKITTIVTRKL